MRRLLKSIEILCWCLAIVLLGSYGYVYLDRTVYQSYESWALGRQLDHKPVSAIGFVLESLRGRAAQPEISKDLESTFVRPQPPQIPAPEPLAAGAPMGRIEIPRLGMRAMIVNGTTAKCLRRAVGHIEGTPVFGQGGNIGLAGHRDTFFSSLSRIRKDDIIEVETLHGVYAYAVDSTRVVGPNDVQVLNATGSPLLTLVTCYPFDYTGPAPQRFIVHAREIAGPNRMPDAAIQPPRGS